MGRSWAGVLGGDRAGIPFGGRKRKGKGREGGWEVDVEGVGRRCGPGGEEGEEGRRGGVWRAVEEGGGEGKGRDR